MRFLNDYYTNQHCCFLLQYHLVLITKYRHPVLTNEIEDWIKEYTKNYFKEHDLIIKSFEVMPDHLHVLFDAPPQINLANLVNAYKSATSRLLRKNFSRQLEPYYWKPYFWSNSYFIGSVSDKSFKVVQNYINNQK